MRFIADALAAAWLAAPFEREALRREAEAILGPVTRTDQRRLVGRLLREWKAPYPPSAQWLKRFLLHSGTFHRASARVSEKPQHVHAVVSPARFAPIDELAHLDVPRLATLGDLAAHLHLSHEDLDWLADARRQHGHTAIPILQHYTFAVIPRRSGPPRLIEEPKPRLKTIQRRILDEILAHVPAHQAAFGFVRGRSCIDAAESHVGEAVVIGCDIANFFPSIAIRRVHGLFRSIGYPASVARALTGLVTTTTPAGALSRIKGPAGHRAALVQLYRQPHLPQGAPTSPALANLCVWRLDCRLTGLARRLEARYTRYADDMTFSGGEELSRKAGVLVAAVRDIVADEGLTLHPAKTRIMRRHGRQAVTGIVVNDRTSLARDDYDRLKATLHNCVRHGWQSQNRDAHPDFRGHLEGRIGWAAQLAPHRAERLRAMLQAIRW